MKDEWVYIPAPLDVVRWLEQAADEKEVPNHYRLLLRIAAQTLTRTLDRCIRLASKLEKTEAGL